MNVLDRRYLLTVGPWRAIGYLASTVPVGVAAAVPFGLLGLPLLLAYSRLQPIWILPGLALLVGLGPLVAMPLADVERARLRLLGYRAVRSGHRPVRAERWLRTRYTEAATWREVAYAVLLLTAGPVLYGALCLVLVLTVSWLFAPLAVGDGPVALGVGTASTVSEALPYTVVGLTFLPALPYLLGVAAWAHAAAARALVGESEELIEVTRSRARLVDAFEAERTRIERDLHDGTQQRLVSLSLQLGVARLLLDDGSPASEAVADAHQQAKNLMVEVRELIHGIRPQLLTDLGLPDAVRELADRGAVPVTVHTSLPGRPASHVESTAYFVVAEALTNVAKHSGASSAAVTFRQEGELLTVVVRDDGCGGASPDRGTGLTGLADRVGAAGGRLLLSSPDGGPTTMRVELPWN
ncbi:sensor histidine kinase [Cryptosporangium arvum]|uniref:sensor histidine kinase n=1 Tax=Cryptosporangium arvum TaxID=80871 RepID=UPI0004B479E7|nr:sensor histidine kinase [Cryptosporangium arvum]